MGQVRPFTEQEFDMAIKLATNARLAYKTHRYSERELRWAMDFARRTIHHPPMTDEHFTALVKELKK